MGLSDPHALVITVSDGVSSGVREDLSGEALAERLGASGFTVERALVADEIDQIQAAILAGVGLANLIVTTGGTGFGPRDVTPEATKEILDREAPGLVHMMLDRGMESTPMAALSRASAGAIGSSLIVNLPGSPRGATENIEAILEIVPHALSLLAGNTAHE